MLQIKEGKHAFKFTLIYRTLNKAATFITLIVLVRILTEEEYGVYNLLYSVISVIGTFASFGVLATIERYQVEYYGRKDFILAHKLVSFLGRLRLISDTVLVLLLLIFWNIFTRYFGLAGYKTHFEIFAVFIVLYSQSQVLKACLDALYLQKHSLSITFYATIIKLAGYGVLLFRGNNLKLVIIIDLIAMIVTIFFMFFIYHKKIPRTEGKVRSFDKNERRKLFSYALFNNFNEAGSGILSTNFDNWIISFAIGNINVGGYALFQRIAKSIRLFNPLQYFMELVKTSFFSLGNKPENSKYRNLYFQILLKLNYIYYIPILSLIFIFRNEILIYFFSSKFLFMSYLLPFIIFFAVLNSFEIPLGLLVKLKERPDILLYSKIFALLNLALGIILIRYWGLIGVAFATGISTLFKNLFQWYFVRKDVILFRFSEFMLKQILIWSVTTALLYFSGRIFNSYVVMAIVLIVFPLVFLYQFRIRLFNNDEVKAFRMIATKKTDKLNRFIKIY